MSTTCLKWCMSNNKPYAYQPLLAAGVAEAETITVWEQVNVNYFHWILICDWTVNQTYLRVFLKIKINVEMMIFFNNHHI